MYKNYFNVIMGFWGFGVLAFLILAEIARKMRKGRFPPFGSVFAEV